MIIHKRCNMRIGIFTDSYYPHISGVATSVEMLKEALVKMGHKVYIVAPNLENSKFIYDREKETIWLPGVKIGLYKLRLAETYSIRAMKIIKKEWDLDIIHTQTEFTISHFARTVARRLKIPVVHTYHTMYEDYVYYLTHGHFDKTARKIVRNIISNFCNKKCDELIVPTEKIKDIFDKRYRITKKINIIPSGIDTKKFSDIPGLKQKLKDLRKKHCLEEDDFIIGSVGRVAAEKSYDKTIINMRKLVDINPKIKFVLVGDGPELDELKTLTKELNLTKNVIFTGLVDYDLVPIYYHLFDVMTSFSKTETQGLTIIEGLASSLPVVCIDDESFRQMVEHKYNGYLFESDDEFQKYILELMTNKELYKTMSMNAKNSIYIYSKEVFAANVLKVYHKAIDKKKQEANK